MLQAPGPLKTSQTTGLFEEAVNIAVNGVYPRVLIALPNSLQRGSKVHYTNIALLELTNEHQKLKMNSHEPQSAYSKPEHKIYNMDYQQKRTKTTAFRLFY